MSVRKYNISKPEKYIKDGVEKTRWANIGTMIEFSHEEGTKISRIIEIPAIGLKANIFEQKDREPESFKTTKVPVEVKNAEAVDTIECPEPESDPNDIPF